MTGTNIEKKFVPCFIEMVSAVGISRYVRADPKVKYLLVVLGRTVKEFECPEEAGAAEKEILELQLDVFLRHLGKDFQRWLASQDDLLKEHLQKTVADYAKYWNAKFQAVSSEVFDAEVGLTRFHGDKYMKSVTSLKGKASWVFNPSFMGATLAPNPKAPEDELGR